MMSPRGEAIGSSSPVYIGKRKDGLEDMSGDEGELTAEDSDSAVTRIPNQRLPRDRIGDTMKP